PSTIELLDAPPMGGLRPAVEVLFASLARCGGSRRVGVLLTGMGADGADGLLQLRTSGGYALAQNEASCAVYCMPRAAVERGAVDEVLPPEQIARRLEAMVGRARAAR
ncbi:MAG: chemotaxis protein CheB, partial [Deltaproteobacteria bacterium]|nr:chemotaxis protein CheB [Deltaproteobacteria bacterium]